MAPLEPWEKVYIKLTGDKTSFRDIDPIHGFVGCAQCHGGKELVASDELDSTFTDTLLLQSLKAEAHEGMVKDPSIDAESNCGSCHADIVERNKNSMHSQLWGEQYKIAYRYNGGSTMAECPEDMNEKFQGECMSCHTTCGQCHVSRPNSVGGGFVSKHLFERQPDMKNNCTACHGSRIGVDFYGYSDGEGLTGNYQDKHFSKFMDCFDCHGSDAGFEDFHGNGDEATNPPRSRYETHGLATCESCHPFGDTQVETVIDTTFGENDTTFVTKNYHETHWPSADSWGAKLACFVCHSQKYYNCNSCHTQGEWKGNFGEVEGETDVHEGDGGYREFPDFRIGHNPAFDSDEDWSPSLEAHSNAEWIVVRHVPTTETTYANWEAENAEIDLSTMETWQYASPHNIRKWTKQTEIFTDSLGNGSCSANCHIPANEENRDLFLWGAYVDSVTEDKNANIHVIVDEFVPESWSE